MTVRQLNDPLRIGQSLLYACLFCKEETLWQVQKYYGQCVQCDAQGTMRMQICKQCLKLNFIYRNRGEVCADCTTVLPTADEF